MLPEWLSLLATSKLGLLSLGLQINVSESPTTSVDVILDWAGHS